MSVGSLEQPLEPEVSTLWPPLLPESGSGGEVEVAGPEEEEDAPREEPGTRPRINLRGVMRSISLLEPSGELDSAPMAEDLPEVRGSLRSSLWVGRGRCSLEPHIIPHGEPPKDLTARRFCLAPCRDPKSHQGIREGIAR